MALDRPPSAAAPALVLALVVVIEIPRHFRLEFRFAGHESLTAHPVVRRGAEGDVPSMRRAVAWGCAIASILALAACGFVRWPLSAAKVGDSLNAAFGASPRLHWSAPQAATFSALPWPSLRIVDARLDDASGVNLLSAPTARLDLSLVELVRGRFIPTRAILVSPTVTLDIDRPPFAGGGGGIGCARERRRSARAVDEPEPVEWRLARRRREARPRHADRQRPGPPRRAHGRQSTALQPVGGVAKRADRDRRRARAIPRRRRRARRAGSNSRSIRRSRNLRSTAQLALGDTPSAEGDMTASVPSIAALAALLNARAAARPRRRRHRHLRQGQGGGGRAYARRCDDDQRRADV